MPEQTKFTFEAKIVDENGYSTRIERSYDPDTFEIQPAIVNVMEDFRKFLHLSGYSEELIDEIAQDVFNTGNK